MKALCYTPDGIRLDTDHPMPTVGKTDVRIRVRMAGICRTDLELAKGYMGYHGVLGHEFVGEIVTDTNGFRAGTRVVGEINAGCGECSYCRKGLERHCPNRSVLGILKRDGCLAEWTALPPGNLLPVPDEVPDELAVMTEPLAAALELFEQIQFQPSDRVCVIGDGKLGLITAMTIARKHEGETLLVGHHSVNLELVQDRMDTVLEESFSQERSRRWDIVVEASGTSEGLRLAMSIVKPRGIVALKSTMAKAEALDLTPLVIDEITVVGSRCGRFEPALSLLAKNVLPLDRTIEAVYPIGQALDAWNRANERGAKKVLLKMIEG